MLNRRTFIKTTSLATLGLMFAGCGGNAATSAGKADLVVYGKIFTSEDNKIVEAFAVKDGKFIYVGDKNGHQGIPNWSEEELTEITRKANANGITMHIHTMGNKGVNRVVNAYIKGGKSEMRNTLVHVYGVIPSDYKRMAENNIYVTSGMLWHHAEDELWADLADSLPASMADKGYPMKSFLITE